MDMRELLNKLDTISEDDFDTQRKLSNVGQLSQNSPVTSLGWDSDKKQDIDASSTMKATSDRVRMNQIVQHMYKLLQQLRSTGSIKESKYLQKELVESFGYSIDEASMDMNKLAQHSAPLSVADVAKKAGGKFLPGIGAGLSWEDAYDRAKKGDWLGAGISGLAGASYLLPGAGWMVGTGLDLINLARDFKGDHQTPTADNKLSPSIEKPESDKESIAKLQQQLKAKGADLGATGPNRDGIDGVLGPKTAEAMKKFGVSPPGGMDPELERLSVEASKKGLLVVRKANQVFLVYPPAQLVYNQQGQLVDPKSLSSLTKVNEGVITSGLGTLFKIVKNFSAKTVKAGANLIKNNPLTAAGIGAGVGAGYYLHGTDIDSQAGSETPPEATPQQAGSSEEPKKISTPEKPKTSSIDPAIKKTIDDIMSDITQLSTIQNPEVRPDAEKAIQHALKTIQIYAPNYRSNM